MRVICTISDYWIEFQEGDLPIDINKDLNDKIQLSNRWASKTTVPDKLQKYATLFSQKIDEYIKKTNGVIIGDQIWTKVIRMSAENFNPREQIILNPSALLSCELEDLLK